MLSLNALTQISQTFISFLGWQSFYVSVLFVLIWLLTRFFKKISPNWQIGLWMLVIIRLILPVNLSFSWSGRAIFAQITDWMMWLNSFFSTQSAKINVLAGVSLSDVEKNIVSGNLNINLLTTLPWGMNILLGTWIIGVLGFLFIFIHQRVQFTRILRQAKTVEEKRILNLLQIWRSDFRISRPVKIVTSPSFLSPFTFGTFRPVIFVPQAILSGENPALLESIIAHEMAHIKRFDDLWIILQNFIQIFYFFHPFVWLTNSRIHLLRECLCDSLVLSRKKITLSSYGQGIINVLKLNLFGTDGIILLPGFGSQKKKIIYRLKNLNGGYTMNKLNSLLKYLVLIVFGFFLLPMASPALLSAENSVIQDINSHDQKEMEKSETLVKSNAIKFEKPLKIGKVSARYGKMKSFDSDKIVMHTGIDIAAPLNTEIYAAATGTVILVNESYEENRGPGKEIVIQHPDGFQTRYTHLNELLVKKDQMVQAGEIIAKVGSTGRSTGPHLHFEIRFNDKPENPEDYIDFKDLKKND
ncbi:peptidoglycan DD-metalloendopeptidase family protein [candidate division KSB1 bacterium]|nr:peptidoglycan DD-metalloendopeptidase family protein [candidate division KSB1 bacterium]